MSALDEDDTDPEIPIATFVAGADGRIEGAVALSEPIELLTDAPPGSGSSALGDIGRAAGRLVGDVIGAAVDVASEGLDMLREEDVESDEES